MLTMTASERVLYLGGTIYFRPAVVGIQNSGYEATIPGCVAKGSGTNPEEAARDLISKRREERRQKCA